MGTDPSLLHVWKDLDMPRCQRDPVPGRRVALAVGRDESCSGSLPIQGGSTLGEAAWPVRMQSTAGCEPSPGAPCQL